MDNFKLARKFGKSELYRNTIFHEEIYMKYPEEVREVFSFEEFLENLEKWAEVYTEGEKCKQKT